MPIYEYECPVCGRFECLQKITAAPLTECPTCSTNGLKTEVERLVSKSAFHLKGSGWYKTDYASGSAGDSNGSSNGNKADSNGTNGVEKVSSDNGNGTGVKKAPKADAKVVAAKETGKPSAKSSATSSSS